MNFRIEGTFSGKVTVIEHYREFQFTDISCGFVVFDSASDIRCL